MNDKTVILTIVIICIITIGMIILMLYTFGKMDADACCGQHIVNKFEPDNTAPKMTDFVDFYRQKDTEQNQMEYKVE